MAPSPPPPVRIAAASNAASLSPSPVTSPSPSVALTPDGIHVSSLDERQFKHLTLANGLEVLLVSDPITESASAAMDVHVGFHCDPEQIPGLAHFCEHMLFLGTQKYPDENSYSAFLAAHGGSSNAYTAARNTNYYFDVATPHLRDALDRFAQFFIAPLFTASATDREMNAVDSENKNYLQDDYWRINQVHRSLGNLNHPFHKFGVGNLESLRDVPSQLGLDVREALLAYHAQYYSANMMKLVVYGKEDVDTLSQWVTEIFQDVLHNARTGPPEFGPEMPFTEDQLGRRLDVLPVKDMNVIGVSWLLPPLRGPRYTLQQTSVISHLIGHEGEGSLLSLLKQRNWVSSISAGVEEEHAEFALFLVNFEATEDGMRHVDEIVEALFQMLRLLRESAPLEKRIFQEMQDLAIMHFLFQSKQAPIHFTSSVATAMQTLAKRDILSQDMLFYPEDTEQISELLAFMTPSRMKLLVVCKANESIVEEEERWYKAKYRERMLDPALVAKWNVVPCHEELALPMPNEFVASDFSLIDRVKAGVVSQPTKGPRRVRDDEWCRVWYKPDVHFKMPRTHAALTFYSPFVNDTPLTYVLSDLVVASVQDELTEYSYDASLAGMHYDLAIQGSCLHLGAVGFSAKLELLVLRVVETLVTIADTLEGEMFERVYQQARKDYENMKYDEAFRLAMGSTSAIMHERVWSTDDLISAITQIEGNVPLLRCHARKLLEQVFLEALVYGNLYEKDALEMVGHVQAYLTTARPVLPSAHTKWLPRQLRLPEQATCVYRRAHPNGENLNCAIDCVFQIGPETMRDRVALAVFSQIVSEPLFNQLRNKEQLGYTVFSTPSRQSGVQWFRVIVQSNVASPEYLEQRLSVFLTDMRELLVHTLTDEQLQKHIQAIVKDYTEKPKSQEEEVQAMSAEIAIREYQFDRRERLARLVATLQRSDVVSFFDTYIADDAPKRKRLSVRVYGKDFVIPSLQQTALGSSAACTFRRETQTALTASVALLPSAASGLQVLPQEIEILNLADFKQQQPFFGLGSDE